MGAIHCVCHEVILYFMKQIGLPAQSNKVMTLLSVTLGVALLICVSFLALIAVRPCLWFHLCQLLLADLLERWNSGRRRLSHFIPVGALTLTASSWLRKEVQEALGLSLQ